jgi:hypothetical protein
VRGVVRALWVWFFSAVARGGGFEPGSGAIRRGPRDPGRYVVT